MKLKLVLKIVAMSCRCVICRISLKMSSAVAINFSGVAPVFRMRTAIGLSVEWPHSQVSREVCANLSAKGAR